MRATTLVSMTTGEPTWQLVLAAARRLGSGGREFTLHDLVREVQRMDPSRGRGSIQPVIQGMTDNAGRGPGSPCGTPLHRVAHGVYELPGGQAPPAAPTGPATPAATRVQRRSGHTGPPHPTTATRSPSTGQAACDVVLVGCVKGKLSRMAPARELYQSPLFARRRAYAERSGRPWFVLSSRWGLVHADERIAPYDLYLGDQSREYQQAWGSFVVAQLVAAIGTIRQLTIEIHAGEHYRSALDGPLHGHGAVPVDPIAATSMGATLAWYNQPAGSPRTGTQESLPPVSAPPPGRASAEEVDSLIDRLMDPTNRLPVTALLAGDDQGLAKPGLYSWWVDADGAQHLSQGLALPISAGLIYAGQAGATRYPSGNRSRNTLWSRLTGMHLGGNTNFSTFRLSLAAVLHQPLGLTNDNDPRLSTWMAEHLTVTAVPVSDPDDLGPLEHAVLERLDPPLNLKSMTPTPIRAGLTALRAARTT